MKRVSLISCSALLFLGSAVRTKGADEPGYIHIRVGNASYWVEKQSGKMSGYDIPGSGGTLKLLLFSESLAPGVDRRGNSPGTVYQTLTGPTEVVADSPAQALLKAVAQMINKHKVSISTRALAPNHWQTVQHWERLEGDTKTSFTILVYVDHVAINRNVVIYNPGQVAPSGTVGIADAASSASAGPGAFVLFPNDRDAVALSLDKSFSVQGFSYGSGLCGFALWFKADESGEFRLTIDHRSEEEFVKRFGSTTVAVDKRDLTTRLWAGPYPVVSKVALVAGRERQDMVPKTGLPAWSGHEQGAAQLWKVAGSGKLAAEWREEVSVREVGKDVACRVSYQTEALPSELRPSLSLRLPDRFQGNTLGLESKRKRTTLSCGRVPCRVGAVMKPGTLAPGDSLRLRVEPLRELLIVPGPKVEVELAKAFDGSGEILLTPLEAVTTLSVELRYAHVAPEVKPKVVPFIAPPASEGLEVYPDRPGPGDVTIASSYWCVVHRKRAGGAVASLRFYHGCGNDLLLQPDETSVTVAGIQYSSRFCANPKVEVRRESPELVRMDVTGELASAQQARVGLKFANSYEYHPWHVVRQCTIAPGQSSINVTEVQVARLDLSPALDECYCRRSGWDVAEWNRAIFPGPDACSLTDGWAYIAAFKRGIEGVELFPRSDLAQWEGQVFPKGGRARFAVVGNEAGGPAILIQPYAHDEPMTLDRPLAFDFYLGLPPIKKHPGRPVMGVSTVVGWLSEEAVKEVVEARPEIILYHYLLAAGALVMKNENRIKAVTQEMDRLRASGSKLIPYTWFRGVHFRANADVKEKAIRESWYEMGSPGVKEPEYTGDVSVCYESAGYREWLKGIQDLMFKETPISGVYYDWMGSFTCYNAKHGPRKHYGMDGVLDLLAWTRQRLGKDGVIVGHVGGGAGEYPCATLEGYTTAVVTLEELYHSSKLPNLYGVQASLEFMGATPRLVCPAIVGNLSGRYLESGRITEALSLRQEFVTKCLLLGYPPYHGVGDPKATAGQPAFRNEDLGANWGQRRLLQTLKQIDFSRYSFRSFARQTAVEADNDFAKVSVFFGDRDALVILGNPESRETQVASFSVDCRQFGWRKAAPSSIKEVSSASADGDKLTQAGGRAVLAGHDFRAYKLERS